MCVIFVWLNKCENMTCREGEKILKDWIQRAWKILRKLVKQNVRSITISLFCCGLSFLTLMTTWQWSETCVLSFWAPPSTWQLSRATFCKSLEVGVVVVLPCSGVIICLFNSARQGWAHVQHWLMSFDLYVKQTCMYAYRKSRRREWACFTCLKKKRKKVTQQCMVSTCAVHWHMTFDPDLQHTYIHTYTGMARQVRLVRLWPDHFFWLQGVWLVIKHDRALQARPHNFLSDQKFVFVVMIINIHMYMNLFSQVNFNTRLI